MPSRPSERALVALRHLRHLLQGGRLFPTRAFEGLDYDAALEERESPPFDTGVPRVEAEMKALLHGPDRHAETLTASLSGMASRRWTTPAASWRSSAPTGTGWTSRPTCPRRGPPMTAGPTIRV